MKAGLFRCSTIRRIKFGFHLKFEEIGEKKEIGSVVSKPMLLNALVYESWVVPTDTGLTNSGLEKMTSSHSQNKRIGDSSAVGINPLPQTTAGEQLPCSA